MAKEKEEKPRLETIIKLSQEYGECSFENYGLVRSFAERIRDGFNKYLGGKEPSVFLVPVQGAFTASNAGSAAFSTYGKGFIALEPISFGLAIRVSKTRDWMRIIITVAKSGPKVDLKIIGGENFSFQMPFLEEELQDFFEHLYTYLKRWFENQIEEYKNGYYGSNEIGFEISTLAEDS